jgi:LPXTG-motif cell wall-anchored protein
MSRRLIVAATAVAVAAAAPVSIAKQSPHPPGATLSAGPAAAISFGGNSSEHRRARSARPVSAQRRAQRKAGLSARVTAHSAGDPGVTIADFHFAPAATTIHAGDTITWSNQGPSSHTATAKDGSFDTGILKKGQSASHTFTQPGTYTYVCQIHPFMHGTIVVLAATTSTTSSGAAAPATTTSAAATPSTTTAAAQTGPSLPNTGFNVLAGLAAGMLLLGLGAGLRRTRRH